MLGWRMLREGDYFVDLPGLSSDEEEIILEASEKFKEEARNCKEKSEDLIRKIVGKIAAERETYLDMEQQEYIARVAYLHIYGFAFIEQLLSDPEIEEISVIGANKPVYVYLRNKGWKMVNAVFENEKTIADLINKMGRGIGRHITMQNPRIDAMLPDGSRLHGSLPPISNGEITIRKFRDKPFSPRELVENKTANLDAIAFLSVLMQCDSSVVIAGNTASGKTTSLNALFSFVPANERVIITEETPEINIPHIHQMRLVANKGMGISLKDLVYDSLRMRPDRMIVGEVRNKEEVEALFDVLLAGQARGCYATFHASSVNEAVSRFASFGVDELDLRSIDCLIIQRRMLYYDKKKRKNTEVRRIVEIAELCNGQKTIYKNGKFSCDGVLLERVSQSFGISKKEMKKEIAARKKLIAKSPSEFSEFYKHLQAKLYGGRK